VLVDTSQAEAAHVPDAVLAALNHCGIPYRLHDLAAGPAGSETVAACPAIVIGQEHLGDRLRPEDVEVLRRGVQAGLGLVNFDHDLKRYPERWWKVVGMAPVAAAAAAGRMALIADNAHFITATREIGERVAFRRPVPVCATRPVQGADVATLLQVDGQPGMVAARRGRGRVVQWLVSPKLWLREVLGHVRGLDDLFWKGIVWAARKPFVTKPMPPFVRIRLDDCRGLWRDGRDFDFVQVLNEWGHVPNLGLCLRAITSDGAKRVKQLFDAGQAEFSPHTLAPDVSLFYGDETGEYSTERLAELFAEMDRTLAEWGVRPSRVLSDHNHMWSRRAIPFLLERGIIYKMNVTCPGETWEGVHVDWRPAPYGRLDYVFDTIPGHPEFFVVFNHAPALEDAITRLPGDRFLFHRDGGFGDVKWDFLNGLTKSTLGHNDLEAIARRYADHVRLGLDSLFFGGVISHSHFLQDLTADDLRTVLRRSGELLARHEQRYAAYEHIAEYARSHVETHLAQVEVSADGAEVVATCEGRSIVPLELYVAREVDGRIERRVEVIGAWDGPLVRPSQVSTLIRVQTL
jgi:hypothetical protein